MIGRFFLHTDVDLLPRHSIRRDIPTKFYSLQIIVFPTKLSLTWLCFFATTWLFLVNEDSDHKVYCNLSSVLFFHKKIKMLEWFNDDPASSVPKGATTLAFMQDGTVSLIRLVLSPWLLLAQSFLKSLKLIIGLCLRRIPFVHGKYIDSYVDTSRRILARDPVTMKKTGKSLGAPKWFPLDC